MYNFTHRNGIYLVIIILFQLCMYIFNETVMLLMNFPKAKTMYTTSEW